jgi:hypothetical protein
MKADDYWALASECRLGDDKVGTDGVVPDLFIVRLDQVEARQFFMSSD